MGAIESKVNVDIIKNEVKTHPIVMYTKDQCSFCTKAKGLLSSENVSFKEIKLDDLKLEKPKEYTSIVNGLVYTTRQTSVPQVFICGKFIGGFSELESLKNTGQLLEAIGQCSGENSPKEI